MDQKGNESLSFIKTNKWRDLSAHVLIVLPLAASIKLTYSHDFSSCKMAPLWHSFARLIERPTQHSQLKGILLHGTSLSPRTNPRIRHPRIAIVFHSIDNGSRNPRILSHGQVNLWIHTNIRRIMYRTMKPSTTPSTPRLDLGLLG
jgi:HD superfamily phosphohydrolase YqeK